jgi:hypothetical protein
MNDLGTVTNKSQQQLQLDDETKQFPSVVVVVRLLTVVA